MTWTYAQLATGAGAGGAPTFTVTTASVTPTSGRLLLVTALGQRSTGAPPASPTIGGGTTLGGTLVELLNLGSGDNPGTDCRWTVWGLITDGSTGTGTVDIVWGTPQLTEYFYEISEWNGYRLSETISTLKVQQGSNFHEGTAQTTTTVTLAAFEDATNNLALTMAELVSDITGNFTPPSGFTEDYERSGSTHGWAIAHKVGESTSMVWTHDSDSGSGIAMELKGEPAAVGGAYWGLHMA